MIALRDLKSQDNSALVKYLNDQDVTRYLSSRIPSPYHLEDAKWFIETGSKQQARVKAIDVDGQFCGVIGLYLQENEYAHSGELGYWLAQPFWGNGVGTLAVKTFTDWVFESTDIQRIFNPVSKPNKGSVRVMEKSGFVLEGVMKNAIKHQGVFVDELMFAKLKTK